MKKAQKKNVNAAASAPAAAPATSPARPATPAERPVDDGQKLIADLQQQFDTLRTWQSNESEKLRSRAAALTDQSRELDAVRSSLEADLAAQNESRRSLQQARETLNAERAEFVTEREDFAVLRQETLDLRDRTDREHEELVTLRADLDDEWSSLCRLRRAHEKLATELDAERERIRGKHNPELKLSAAA